jgi:hypothetical protein
MKSKTTVIWLVLAVALATAIWLLNNYFLPAAPGEKLVFSGLRGTRVTGIQIVPGGAGEISVIRTNKTWQLERPFAYPAQAAAIDALLGALEKLTPVLSLSAGELNSQKNANAEFGFDNPQFTLDVTAGGQVWHVQVGNQTAPGDGVYVRVVGETGAYVTGTGWLRYLPHDAAVWRDTTLVVMPDLVDWLVITNGTQAIELRRDLTNRLWRMVRPMQARADNLGIVSALMQLRTAKVSRFVTDDPKADLTTYGLEPAALDVWLGYGTNLLTAIHAGKDVTDAAGEMFARREGWHSVVATLKQPLAPWLGKVNDFRDRHLLEPVAPAEIEIQGEHPVILQQRGSNVWAVAGEKFPTDPETVNVLISTLTGLRVSDFVQDVVTTKDLQGYGLLTPSLQVTLRSTAGDTNSVMGQLLFGAVTNNQIFVKRGDELPVYSLWLADINRLTLPADFYRAHQIWNFSETNVAQVTVRQFGRTRQMIRTGANDWSLAPGSQGIINPPALEETIHQLGDLSVLAWIGRKFSDTDIGLGTNNPSVTIELKSGEKYSVDFGMAQEIPSLKATTGLAVVTLEGERWAFIFPPVLYPLVAENLTIPPNTP